MMRAQLRKPLTVLGSVLAAGALAASAGAASADAAVTKAAPANHCAVLVGKSVNGAVSPVLARACDTTATGAHAKMARQATGDGVKSAKSSVPLMAWDSDADFRGASTVIWGSAGPCDSAGYRLSLDLYWRYAISSAWGYVENGCNTGRFTNRAGTYAATFRLPVSYVGSALNDNVGSILVSNG